MVIDLIDTYRMMMLMMRTIRMMETQNAHNSDNFETTTSRFCIDINDTYRLYFYAKS